MTIEEALHTATEAGYHVNSSDGVEAYYSGANSEYSVWIRKDNDSSFIVVVAETFLDPVFWRALGRVLRWQGNIPPDFALHWDVIDDRVHENIAHDLLVKGIPMWLYHWHRFVDYLAEGKTPEDFFASLPSLRMDRRRI